MAGSVGGAEAMFRIPSTVSRAAKILTVLSAPLALACTSAMLPVFLPGERVDCLFEVVGELTVPGPFPARDDLDGAPREVVLQGVRLEVGQEAAGSGADAVMVRELVYDRDLVAAENDAPEIIAVEGMLVSFVDPACIPDV